MIVLIVFLSLALGLASTGLGYWIWRKQGGHKCRGYEKGRRFVPGIAERGGRTWGWAADDDKIIRGYTEITYQCKTCGKFFNNYVTGRVNE